MLTELKPGIFYWQGGVNFGILVAPDRQLVLIDAGLDASAPRKALRPLLAEGYRLSAIVATHCHADHIGGAAELQRRFGCAVYAPAPEQVVLEHPELAPALIYGAYPPPALQGKFLQPQEPCPVAGVVRPGTLTVAGLSLEVIPLPGHSPGQVGIATDGVLFAGDGVFLPEVLSRHPILFLVRVDAFLESLDRLAARSERLVVPGHGAHLERPAAGPEQPAAGPEHPGADPLLAAIAADQDHVGAIEGLMAERLAAGPAAEEELLEHVAARLGKAYDNDPSYYLDRAALAAHLSHLARRGAILPAYAGTRRRWQRAG